MKTVAIKERPILFSAPMIRAILDGKKTQTRRVAKLTEGGHVRLGMRRWHPHDEAARLACPYGQPGERLWVRETWQHEDGSCADHKCGQPTHIYYKATEVAPETMYWRPSIFMQRWASRLTLEIVAVRLERLKDITHEDAVAEGCYRIEPCEAYPHGNAWGRAGYAALWESINGKGSWDANPLVWVVEFERLSL